MLRLFAPPVCGRCASKTLRPQSALVADLRQLHPRKHNLTTPAPFARIPQSLSTHATPSIIPRRPQSTAFEPLKPPSPALLGRPGQAKQYRRTRKWLRRLVRTSIVVAVVLGIDNYAYDQCLTRCFKTFYTGLVVAVDYKINFRPDPWIGDSVADVHARSASRVFELLRNNGGLYLKIGQAIAMQSAILPPEFQKMFARMFDDATQNDWNEVQQVVRADFGGRSVEEVFGVSFDGDPGRGIMERTARASASVAQVHWARLQDGREVAIKIQKREIARQVGWDLWAFKVVTKIYTWWFDLPLYHLVPYISDRLMLETDFQNEAKNSEKMRQYIQNEPRLRGRVYIPRVYHELSSKRVMTAEWIEGIRLWDKEGITGSWHGGWRKGSPGSGGRQLPPPPRSVAESVPTNHPDDEKLKPVRDEWRGPGKNGGLGLSLRPVMQTMVDLFSAQMFLWGLVHCDPHPGNIFIRRLPNGKPELVLIDHGLYIQMSPKFRREYALFWRSLMTFDNATINRITKEEWGINAPEIFASATLMSPYQGGNKQVMRELQSMSKKEQRERQFEMQQKMRKGVREMLVNQDKFPQELIFIGRNLRIVQGNNQFLGSPVNRVKITGTWASRALAENREASAADRWKEYGRHLLFRLALSTTDLVFYWSKFRQWVGWGKGMDDDIEESMRKMASGMGVELQHDVFAG
ncbi:ABC1-domain-containing protein [Teratosphaeria nubilosa]|uniref:ABC1-domain-containing protein n=1 Tax=Teratosphaeria nubilosa TaxID=161662 RepID=A0A6G1LMN5_9PEZI|nr:ABC1-domain-containing protein [Teratosphaeria nubilosa]